MEPVITIIFTDNVKKQTLGAVTFENGSLTPTNDYSRDMVDFYLDRGTTPQEWVKKFSNWSNGYISSQIAK